MTTKMILFIIIIIFWLIIGIIGAGRAKENRIHWEMIIFITFVPFIPLIAMLCGLK